MPLERFPTQTGCCHTPFCQKKSPIFILHFNQPPSVSMQLPSLFSVLHSTCGPVRNAFAPASPYIRRSAQVIRPHHEDICATLINERVVLPPNLPSPVLSRLSSSWGGGLLRPPKPDVCPCATAASRLPASHCGYTPPTVCWQFIRLHLHPKRRYIRRAVTLNQCRVVACHIWLHVH